MPENPAQRPLVSPHLTVDSTESMVLMHCSRFFLNDLEPEKESDTWESTIIFLSSSFMYIAVAVSFSKGPPFRKPIYTNGRSPSRMKSCFVVVVFYLVSGRIYIYIE